MTAEANGRRAGASSARDAGISEAIVSLGRILVPRLRRKFGVTPETAEDIYQEAAIKFVQQCRSAGLPENPEAWLWTVTRNACTDWFRRTRASVDDHVVDDFELELLPGESRNEAQWSLVLDCVRNKLAAFRRRSAAEERIAATLIASAGGASMREIQELNDHESEGAAAVFVFKCRKLLQPVLAPCRQLRELLVDG